MEKPDAENIADSDDNLSSKVLKEMTFKAKWRNDILDRSKHKVSRRLR